MVDFIEFFSINQNIRQLSEKISPRRNADALFLGTCRINPNPAVGLY